MAVSCGFYNSVSGDRKYNAEQMSAIFNYLITDGVLMDYGKKFQVDPGSGRQIIVRSGWAWFDSTWTENDNDLPLAIETPDVSYRRYDAVVIEVNKNQGVRNNTIKIVKGVPSANPVKPTLENTTYIKQHAVAYITVNAGATSIAVGDIERMVGKSACPYITGILQTVSVQSLFNRWESDYQTWSDDMKLEYERWVAQKDQNYNEWKNASLADYESWSTRQKEDYQAWLDNNQADFDEWFEHIQLVLSEDVVANLQLQIDANAKAITDLETKVNEDIATKLNDYVLKTSKASVSNVLERKSKDMYVTPYSLYPALMYSTGSIPMIYEITESLGFLFGIPGETLAHGILVNGGGGGGAGYKTSDGYYYGGGGGGGGGISHFIIPRLSTGSQRMSIDVTIGAGGRAGTDLVVGGMGDAGGATRINLITEGPSFGYGGYGGKHNYSGKGGSGGSGGGGGGSNEIRQSYDTYIGQGGDGTCYGGGGGGAVCKTGVSDTVGAGGRSYGLAGSYGIGQGYRLGSGGGGGGANGISSTSNATSTKGGLGSSIGGNGGGGGVKQNLGQYPGEKGGNGSYSAHVLNFNLIAKKNVINASNIPTGGTPSANPGGGGGGGGVGINANGGSGGSGGGGGGGYFAAGGKGGTGAYGGGGGGGGGYGGPGGAGGGGISSNAAAAGGGGGGGYFGTGGAGGNTNSPGSTATIGGAGGGGGGANSSGVYSGGAGAKGIVVFFTNAIL